MFQLDIAYPNTYFKCVSMPGDGVMGTFEDPVRSPLWGTGNHQGGPLLSGTGRSWKALWHCWYFQASRRTRQ